VLPVIITIHMCAGQKENFNMCMRCSKQCDVLCANHQITQMWMPPKGSD
jgi:hypothetical protein